MPIEPQAFRDAMSRFASAVHVVTTDGPGGRRGVTATAAVSVSDDPATLLTCLNATNPDNARFIENGNFAVNTLAAEDQPIAMVFAGAAGVPKPDRFGAGRWETGASGAPLLASALVAFDCRIKAVETVGTHYVLIGEVTELRQGPLSPPLLYHARGYRLL